MTGTPSAFGKQLLHILCPGSKPLVSCHCAKIVYGFWEAQLSAPIKTALSGQKFSATTYQDMFKHADDAWRANTPSSTPAVVAAVEGPSNPPTSPTEQQVAAVTQRGGRGYRGGRGGQRGGRGQNRGGRGGNSGGGNNNSSTTSSNNKSHQRGPKHSDLPAVASWACAQHWKKGRGAPYCSDPLVCEWVQIVAPRTTSTTN